MDNLEIDYKKAAQQLRSGEALFGKDGALAGRLPAGGGGRSAARGVPR